jgi:hypothetical protein
MVCGHIHPDVRWLALQMHDQTSTKKVRELTGTSEHSVWRWAAFHSHTGDVGHTPEIPGRPPLLSGLDVAVNCYFYI